MNELLNCMSQYLAISKTHVYSNANIYDTRDVYINNQAGHEYSERPNNCALGI